MKTSITYKKLNGGDGIEFANGNITDQLAAKRALAEALMLPAVDQPFDRGDDVDARLRHGGIEPSSVQTSHLSE